MKKMVVGAIGLGLAGAAVGMYMSMPQKNQKKIKRGLEDTGDDLKEVMEGFSKR